MNNFEKHGIKNTSASSLNMWTEAPDAWCAKYLFGAKFGFSPAARAGTLAEDAVVMVLSQGVTEKEAIDKSVEAYRRATALDFSDKTRERGEMIPGMVSLALKELSQYGEPEFDNGKQLKININCKVDDWTIPVLGYLDFYFPSHGLVVDLKTSSRLPSEMSKSHLRQQAIYKASMGNCAVKFLYVTGKKSAVYEPENTSDTLSEIKNILRRQNNFLGLDIEIIRSTVPVLDSFYWSDDYNLRREIYGY